MNFSKKQMLKWIEALRSGKYKQGKGSLQNAGGYCCLGVACEVLIPARLKDKDGPYLLGGLPSDQTHAPEWLEALINDFRERVRISLVFLNDGANASFDEIADLLEAVYILEVMEE